MPWLQKLTASGIELSEGYLHLWVARRKMFGSGLAMPFSIGKLSTLNDHRKRNDEFFLLNKGFPNVISEGN